MDLWQSGLWFGLLNGVGVTRRGPWRLGSVQGLRDVIARVDSAVSSHDLAFLQGHRLVRGLCNPHGALVIGRSQVARAALHPALILLCRGVHLVDASAGAELVGVVGPIDPVSGVHGALNSGHVALWFQIVLYLNLSLEGGLVLFHGVLLHLGLLFLEVAVGTLMLLSVVRVESVHAVVGMLHYLTVLQLPFDDLVRLLSHLLTLHVSQVKRSVVVANSLLVDGVLDLDCLLSVGDLGDDDVFGEMFSTNLVGTI